MFVVAHTAKLSCQQSKGPGCSYKSGAIQIAAPGADEAVILLEAATLHPPSMASNYREKRQQRLSMVLGQELSDRVNSGGKQQ